MFCSGIEAGRSYLQHWQFKCCCGVTSWCHHSLENLTLHLSSSVLVGLKGWAVGECSCGCLQCAVAAALRSPVGTHPTLLLPLRSEGCSDPCVALSCLGPCVKWDVGVVLLGMFYMVQTWNLRRFRSVVFLVLLVLAFKLFHYQIWNPQYWPMPWKAAAV